MGDLVNLEAERARRFHAQPPQEYPARSIERLEETMIDAFRSVEEGNADEALLYTYNTADKKPVKFNPYDSDEEILLPHEFYVGTCGKVKMELGYDPDIIQHVENEIPNGSTVVTDIHPNRKYPNTQFEEYARFEKGRLETFTCIVRRVEPPGQVIEMPKR